MKIGFIFFSLNVFIGQSVISQNLVENGSFDNHNNCATNNIEDFSCLENWRFSKENSKNVDLEGDFAS